MSDEQEKPNEVEELEPVDPEFAGNLIAELSRLEVKLQAEGSSLLALLKHVAHTAAGIRL